MFQPLSSLFRLKCLTKSSHFFFSTFVHTPAKTPVKNFSPTFRCQKFFLHQDCSLLVHFCCHSTSLHSSFNFSHKSSSYIFQILAGWRKDMLEKFKACSQPVQNLEQNKRWDEKYTLQMYIEVEPRVSNLTITHGKI